MPTEYYDLPDTHSMTNIFLILIVIQIYSIQCLCQANKKDDGTTALTTDLATRNYLNLINFSATRDDRLISGSDSALPCPYAQNVHDCVAYRVLVRVGSGLSNPNEGSVAYPLSGRMAAGLGCMHLWDVSVLWVSLATHPGTRC